MQASPLFVAKCDNTAVPVLLSFLERPKLLALGRGLPLSLHRSWKTLSAHIGWIFWLICAIKAVWAVNVGVHIFFDDRSILTSR